MARKPNFDGKRAPFEEILGSRLRRDLPFWTAVVGSLLVAVLVLEHQAWIFSGGRGTPDDLTASLLRDPLLALTDEQAAVEVAPDLKLGVLARLLKSSSSDEVDRAFLKAFMADPALRAGLRSYVDRKDFKDFLHLLRGPELAALLNGFRQDPRFQSRLAFLASDFNASTRR